MSSTKAYNYPGPPPPPKQPDYWALDTWSDQFDPAIHLQIEPPKSIKDLDFEDVCFPFSPKEKMKKGGLAYTRSFRVLSEEGVRAARRAVDNARERYPQGEVKYPIGKGNKRATHFVRGLGYTSKFVRDITYDRTLTDLLSDLAREELWPHSMTMSVGHTNVGQPATGKPVDKWHVDSVSYVLVIVISDIKDMEGGKLTVLQHPDSGGTYWKKLQIQGVPPELVETVSYTAPGYAILMQGSKILHAVTPVLKAREPRYSLVNSYMSTDVFLRDPTKYHTFLEKGFDDRTDVVPLEFARHKAWRIKGQMAYILDEAPFGSKPEDLAKVFTDAGAELCKTAALLLGKEEDLAGHIDDEEEEAASGKVKVKRNAVILNSRM